MAVFLMSVPGRSIVETVKLHTIAHYRNINIYYVLIKPTKYTNLNIIYVLKKLFIVFLFNVTIMFENEKALMSKTI